MPISLSGSLSLTGSIVASGNLTTTGTITAQTLVVQTITSSIVNMTGSNIFGSQLSDRQTFTGSVIMTGSQTIFGNAGIGTAPSVTAGITELAIGSSNTNPLINGIRDGVSAFSLSSDSGGTLLNERRNLDLRFSSNNIERMRISAAGTASFTCNSLSNSADAATINLKQNSTTANTGIYLERSGERRGYYMYIGGSVDSLNFRRNDVGTQSDVMSLTRDGNVGIGTCAPSQKLEVVGGEIKAGRVDSTNEGGQVSFGRASDNNTAWYIDSYGNAASPQLRFVNVDNAVVTMTITGSNVGIGTSSPTGLLSLKAEQTNIPTIVFQNTSNAASSAISNFVVNSQTYTVIGTNSYVNNTGNISRFNASYAASFIAFDEGDIVLASGTSGITPTARMRVLSGGDINTLGGNIRALGGGYVLRDSANTTTGGLFTKRMNWLGSGSDLSPAIAAETGYGIYTYTNGNASPSGPYVAAGGTTWTNGSSDVRKKKNFETTQGLAEILQVEPIKYHFNEDDDDSKKRLGFKAQNILPLIPEMVSETGELAEDGSPYLTITPDYILPVLVKAIQEQQCTINTLKTCIGIA